MLPQRQRRMRNRNRAGGAAAGHRGSAPCTTRTKPVVRSRLGNLAKRAISSWGHPACSTPGDAHHAPPGACIGTRARRNGNTRKNRHGAQAMSAHAASKQLARGISPPAAPRQIRGHGKFASLRAFRLRPQSTRARVFRAQWRTARRLWPCRQAWSRSGRSAAGLRQMP